MAVKCDCGFDFTTGTLEVPSKAATSSRDERWRIPFLILAVALIPAFVTGVCLAVGVLRPTTRFAMSAVLMAAPLGYWFVYLPRRGRPWARYLVLIAALAALLLASWIIYSFAWRIMNPM